MPREWTQNRTSEDFAAHLLAHREIDESGCWNWTRSRSGNYGQLWYPERKRALPVSRIAAHLWLGLDLDRRDLYACHRCDNGGCFNPDHLFIGTNSENIIDARNKGRLNRQRGEQRPNARLTENDVRELRQRHAAGGVSFCELGREYGLSDETIRQAVNGKNWAHVH